MHEHFGAPDLADGGAAAEEEVAFAASLCNHPLDTLIAVHRTHEAAKSARRSARLRPHGRAASRCARSAFLEVEGEEEPGEEVDLVTLAKPTPDER